MVEDQATHFEHMEKAHQELSKKHANTQKDISQIMELLATLTKGKKSVKAPNPQLESIPLRSANEDPLYAPGFMPTCEPQMTYPSQS